MAIVATEKESLIETALVWREVSSGDDIYLLSFVFHVMVNGSGSLNSLKRQAFFLSSLSLCFRPMMHLGD